MVLSLLRSIGAVCDGIADWLLLPNVEPGHEEVIDAFRQWTACESCLAVNKGRMGLNRNTQEAVVRALLLRTEVVVHLKDDTVPSPDAFRYFDWAVGEVLIPDIKSKDGHQITLVSGYNKPKSQPGPDQSHLCDTRPIWTPWGWGMDRSRLTWLLANWCTGNPKCFTCQIKAQYRRTRRELFPVLSRIQNIGYDLGENGRAPKWYRANHRTPWVSGRAESGKCNAARRISCLTRQQVFPRSPAVSNDFSRFYSTAKRNPNWCQFNRLRD